MVVKRPGDKVRRPGRAPQVDNVFAMSLSYRSGANLFSTDCTVCAPVVAARNATGVDVDLVWSIAAIAAVPHVNRDLGGARHVVW